MPLTVEDGTGKADADAYVSLAGCAAYATARGLAFTSSDALKEQAIVRATAWLDGRYRQRWQGYRRYGRNQALDWPRLEVVDETAREAIEGNELPAEVVRATCEAAIRELAVPNSLNPDLERGGAVQRLKAGSVEIEYSAGAPAITTYRIIDELLAPLLSATAGGFTSRATRG
jgi:hypothetical protein